MSISQFVLNFYKHFALNHFKISWLKHSRTRAYIIHSSKPMRTLNMYKFVLEEMGNIQTYIHSVLSLHQQTETGTDNTKRLMVISA